jgi:predicted transposase YdaD
VATIIVYKFSTLNRKEIEAMLGLNLEEPRAILEAKEEGREEEARSLILKLLNRRLGKVPQQFQPQIQALSVEQLEALGEALLDFSAMADLEGWLQDQAKG